MTATQPVALVTGASSGIGKAAALALAQAGFEVVGTSRNTSQVTPRDGVTFLDLDVTSDESVTTAVKQVIDRFGRIDVLVNNAGIGSAGAAEEISIAQDQSGLRRQRLRRRPDDQGRPAAHARSGTRAHHQHLVRSRVCPAALHGQLRRVQARGRGLLRVGGPRGPRARRPGAARRARLHQYPVRRERGAGRHPAAGLRSGHGRPSTTSWPRGSRPATTPPSSPR